MKLNEREWDELAKRTGVDKDGKRRLKPTYPFGSEKYDVRVAAPAPAPKPSKYRNRRVTITHPRWGSRTFPSVAESERYKHNLARLESGGIAHQHLQVPFMLPGGLTYWCDFAECYANRAVVYTEIAGVMRRERIRQLKALLAEYPHLEIQVLKYIRGEGLLARFEPHPKWKDPRPGGGPQ